MIGEVERYYDVHPPASLEEWAVDGLGTENRCMNTHPLLLRHGVLLGCGNFYPVFLGVWINSTGNLGPVFLRVSEVGAIIRHVECP